MTATISMGRATDYLYSLAQQSVAGVTVNGDPALAVDGWGHEPVDGMFYVGVDRPPPDPNGEARGARSWASLGGGAIQEDYGVPCCIDIRVAGKEQKVARDIAEGVFNTFWGLIVANPSSLTLGGILQEGRYAEIDSLVSTPANVGTAAEPGRRQVITFNVHCRNVIRT